jgi:diguanylate cyclase (GGDEF)-like protein
VREPFAIIAGDIDHFRAVNTTYGHLVADAVLIKAARTIKDSL